MFQGSDFLPSPPAQSCILLHFQLLAEVKVCRCLCQRSPAACCVSVVGLGRFRGVIPCVLGCFVLHGLGGAHRPAAPCCHVCRLPVCRLLLLPAACCRMCAQAREDFDVRVMQLTKARREGAMKAKSQRGGETRYEARLDSKKHRATSRRRLKQQSVWGDEEEEEQEEQ